MKEIDKQEAEARIASIEAEAASLREWLNQQDEEESQATPKADEVWEDADGGRRFIMTCAEDKQHCELPTQDCEAEIYSNDVYEEDHFIKRLGTFDEVYADRAKLSEEGYIHKDEIARVLTKDIEENSRSYATRLNIADSLEIETY